MAAMAPWMWFAGFAGLVALAIIFPNPIILIIVAVRRLETYRRWKIRKAGGAASRPTTGSVRSTGPRRRRYLGLIAVLVIGMTPRTDAHPRLGAPPRPGTCLALPPHLAQLALHSRAISRLRIDSRLSYTSLPFARAISTLAREPLK